MFRFGEDEVGGGRKGCLDERVAWRKVVLNEKEFGMRSFVGSEEVWMLMLWHKDLLDCITGSSAVRLFCQS